MNIIIFKCIEDSLTKSQQWFFVRVLLESCGLSIPFAFFWIKKGNRRGLEKNPKHTMTGQCSNSAHIGPAGGTTITALQTQVWCARVRHLAINAPPPQAAGVVGKLQVRAPPHLDDDGMDLGDVQEISRERFPTVSTSLMCF